MASPLMFFHASKVVTVIQVKAIYSPPYVHFCVTTGREHWHEVFAGIAVFTRLRCLNIITSTPVIRDDTTQYSELCKYINQLLLITGSFFTDLLLFILNSFTKHW